MIDIICYHPIAVDDEAIIIKYQDTNIRICLQDCAKNYAAEKGLEMSKCVATRDITSLSFIFYTCPKTKIVFKKRILRDLIPSKSATSKFFDLQKALMRFGYTSCDLS